MNEALLWKVVEHAEVEPRRFNMREWYVNATGIVTDVETIDDLKNPEVFEGYEDVPPCGAVGCVAGTCCIISGVSTKQFVAHINGMDIYEYQMPYGGWFHNAMNLLSLTLDQAERLFYPGYGFEPLDKPHNVWPEPFKSQYHENANNPQERVRILRERVAHFIATNGAE